MAVQLHHDDTTYETISPFSEVRYDYDWPTEICQLHDAAVNAAGTLDDLDSLLSQLYRSEISAANRVLPVLLERRGEVAAAFAATVSLRRQLDSLGAALLAQWDADQQRDNDEEGEGEGEADA